MNLWRIAGPKVVCPEHDRQRRAECPVGIGKEARYARQRLLALGIKDVQDHADEQGVRLVDPVPEISELALRVHENIGNVLDVAHFAMPLTHFHQGIEMRRDHVGRVEPHAVGKLRAPA